MTRYLKDEQYFKGSDLSFAAVCEANGFTIDALDRSDPKKTVFLIKKKEGFDNLLQAFWQRSLLIEPRAYFDSLKAVKSRLYQTS